MIIQHKLLTPGEIAKELGISLATACRLVRLGEIPGHKIGRQWRVDRFVFDAYMADNKSTPMRAPSSTSSLSTRIASQNKRT